MDLEMLERQHRWNIFHGCDVDQDGKIGLEDLKNIIKGNEAEHLLPANIVKEIFEKADRDKDGRLDFDEFNVMFIEKENSFVFFRFQERFRRYIQHSTAETNENDNSLNLCFIYIIFQMILCELIISYKNNPTNKRYGFIASAIQLYVHFGWNKIIVSIVFQILKSHLWIKYIYQSLFSLMATMVALLIAAYCMAVFIIWTEKSPVTDIVMGLILLCVDVGPAFYHIQVFKELPPFPYSATISSLLDKDEVQEVIGPTLFIYGAIIGIFIIIYAIQYID